MKIYNKAAGKVLIEVPGNDFSNANLRKTNLHDADLSNADLSNADLSNADLQNADLHGADLRNTDLCGANLRNADLSFANLRDADLSYADLRYANVSNTCLDSENPIPEIETSEILNSGLQIDGEYVVGWRTARSQHCGDTVYESGKTYTAPWFSTDITECHPGLYLASESWLKKKYSDKETIRVRCLRSDLHKAGDKWRCRKLEVLS